ncbi:hypothetical protein JXA88_12295 [Candidatus Fermentibacteria bacterium]|nr:hypothetical protein [Candidatus Fermentibacteria bacterium]
MRWLAFVVLIASALTAEEIPSTDTSPGREDRQPTVSAPSGRLAQAISRLQGGPAHRRQARNRYRLVTLLDGKLTARVPI